MEPSLVMDTLLLVKIFIAGALGALIGIEREYAKKQHLFGARTFLLVSLIGMLSIEVSKFSEILSYFPILCFASILLLSYYFYQISLRTRKGGLTTFALFPLAFIIGVFVSYSLFVDAVAMAVIITAVLYSKRYSVHIIEKLTEDEWSDIVRFAIIIFVLYPISPPSIMLYGLTFNIDMFFRMIYFVSGVSFIAFLLHRLYPNLPVYVVGFLGGLVNHISSISLISSKAKQLHKSLFNAYSASISASSLMNLAFIALFSLPLFQLLWPVYIIVILVHLAAQFFTESYAVNIGFLKLRQPFTISRAVKFAIVFIVVSAVLGYITTFSNMGIYFVSFLGGTFSSVATVSSILATESGLSLDEKAVSAVCAFLGSLSSSAVIGYFSHQREMRIAIGVSLLVSVILIVVAIALLFLL